MPLGGGAGEMEISVLQPDIHIYKLDIHVSVRHDTICENDQQDATV